MTTNYAHSYRFNHSQTPCGLPATRLIGVDSSFLWTPIQIVVRCATLLDHPDKKVAADFVTTPLYLSAPTVGLPPWPCGRAPRLCCDAAEPRPVSSVAAGSI